MATMFNKTLADVNLNIVIYQTLSSFVYFWGGKWMVNNETKLCADLKEIF